MSCRIVYFGLYFTINILSCQTNGEEQLETSTAPENTDNGKAEPYRMRPYLIAVICLSVIFAVVVAYKLYKYLSTKTLRIPCCVEGPGASKLHRTDTSKPLIRSSSSRAGSIYKQGSQRPSMV